VTSPTTVAADDVASAVAAVVTALGPAVDRDWSVPAGSLDWDCRHTAEHLADGLVAYAGQVAAHPGDRYVRFQTAAEPAATPEDLLEFVVAGGGMLAATVRYAHADLRAYHPSGPKVDPVGFAAMGCVEALVHGYDLASGLGLSFQPPADVCARTLTRLFPAVTADADPWRALLWAAARIDLPGLPRPATMLPWHGEPR
jgi:uncharacterized protein (TIGR03083 family)